VTLEVSNKLARAMLTALAQGCLITAFFSVQLGSDLNMNLMNSFKLDVSSCADSSPCLNFSSFVDSSLSVESSISMPCSSFLTVASSLVFLFL
jgi:hypothetical protein